MSIRQGYKYSLPQKDRHHKMQSPAQHRPRAIRPKPGPTFFHSKPDGSGFEYYIFYGHQQKSRQKVHSALVTLVQNPFTIRKDRPEKLAGRGIQNPGASIQEFRNLYLL